MQLTDWFQAMKQRS